MLAKFRINFSDVTTIPDVTKKASEFVKAEFNSYAEKAKVSKDDLAAQSEKTNRNLRLAELLRDNSKKSEMVIM